MQTGELRDGSWCMAIYVASYWKLVPVPWVWGKNEKSTSRETKETEVLNLKLCAVLCFRVWCRGSRALDCAHLKHIGSKAIRRRSASPHLKDNYWCSLNTLESVVIDYKCSLTVTISRSHKPNKGGLKVAKVQLNRFHSHLNWDGYKKSSFEK